MMYKYVYLEVNLLSICILLYILYCLHGTMDKQSDNVYFIRVIIALIAILALDSAWTFVEGRMGTFYYTANTCINAIFLFMTGVISFLWLCYVRSNLNFPPLRSKRKQLLLLLPLIALGVLCIHSVQTQWLFYIDADNVYHRGNYVFLQILLGYSYLFISAIYIIREILRTEFYQKRKELYSLLVFFLLPTIGTIIGTAVYGLPILWPTATLATLIIFINLQSYRISTDALTGLNNRRQFDTRLHALLNEAHHGSRFTLLLIDLDRFKSINDRFGHYEGDCALKETAEIMKTLCKGKDVFLARYGGDEFAILCNYDDDAQIQDFEEKLHAAFAQRNENTQTSYEITVSVGHEKFSPSTNTMHSLIAGADRQLYDQKQRRAE